MKTKGCILRSIIVSMFLLLAFGTGFSQDGIKVSIPFNFIVGTQSFPPGDYTLKPLPLSLNKMLLRNQAGEVLTSIQTNSAESRVAPGSGKLVFNQYGWQYFLVQIWEPGSRIGQRLVTSPAEIQMAKASHTPAELVALSSAPQR
jgi:hypothetical protein